MTSTRSEWPWRFFFLLVAAVLLLCLNINELSGRVKAAHIELPEVVCEETTTVVVPEPQPSEADVQHLAIAIYREAGGDAVCDHCRYRVGDVVLNRVSDPRYPDTLEAVLTQRGQYGTMYWDGVTWPKRASRPEEQHAVARAEETAYALLTGTHSDLAGQGYIFQSEFPDLGHSATTCCGIYYAKG